MECEMCGCEVAEPESLRPVYEVLLVETGREIEGLWVATGQHEVLADEPMAVCEDCYPEAFEPERQWRLKHECPICWSHPCKCEPVTDPTPWVSTDHTPEGEGKII